MPAKRNTCPVCNHAERVRIEDLRARGVSFRELEKTFGIRYATLHKHWHEHTSADRKLSYLVGRGTLEQLRERATEESLSVLDGLRVVRSILMGQLASQAEAGSAMAVANVAARLVETLREIGRLTGEVQRQADAASVTINNNVAIMGAPGSDRLQEGLLQIARDHPDAKDAIIALLRGLSGGDDTSPRRAAPLLINGAAVHG